MLLHQACTMIILHRSTTVRGKIMKKQFRTGKIENKEFGFLFLSRNFCNFCYRIQVTHCQLKLSAQVPHAQQIEQKNCPQSYLPAPIGEGLVPNRQLYREELIVRVSWLKQLGQFQQLLISAKALNRSYYSLRFVPFPGQ